MPEYLKRMKEEHKALRAKMYALNGFINGNLFNSIPDKKKELMMNQLKAMEVYAEILAKRITIEVKEHESTQ